MGVNLTFLVQRLLPRARPGLFLLPPVPDASTALGPLFTLTLTFSPFLSIAFRVICASYPQRTFLKHPESKKNIPIHAIGLSLYESLPGTTAEQIGQQVVRTQWLYVLRS